MQYILLDLPDDAPEGLDAPGTVLQLQVRSRIRFAARARPAQANTNTS